ncbi:uncharacterized protein AB675_7286 [Cyphellophora attinorum]|uniref:Uncharacterized protein n=1 Tax=Cyphellophora attinorum TaxID=1664694 RepID=A0A0N1HN29_9EURO|nr:uncharacterized protein AB675_7286 [Phialophora attinorum]KPI36332.1 hypothetical protein AB675_7286 [Phialophora attinorum]
MADTDSADNQLMDLPAELLQMIFKAVLRDQQVSCWFFPYETDRSPRALRIRYPASLIVSRRYFAEAKQAVLRHANVVLGEYKWHLSPHEFTMTTDFQFVHCLSIPFRLNFNLRLDHLKDIIKAAPGLEKLILTLPAAIWTHSDTELELLTGRSTFPEAPFAARLQPKAGRPFKELFQDNLLEIYPDHLDKLGYHMHAPFLAWLESGKKFDLCFRSSANTAGDQVKRCHHWDAIYSTRKHIISIRPGKDNCVEPWEHGPDYDVHMESAFFDRLIDNYVLTPKEHTGPDPPSV